MKLTRAKREAAELENELRKGEVHRTEDIERGIKSMFLNIRSRFLALPAKLSPTLATMGGNQTGIFDELKQAIDEILEEMSDYRVAFAVQDGESDGEEAGIKIHARDACGLHTPRETKSSPHPALCEKGI